MRLRLTLDRFVLLDLRLFEPVPDDDGPDDGDAVVIDTPDERYPIGFTADFDDEDAPG